MWESENIPVRGDLLTTTHLPEVGKEVPVKGPVKKNIGFSGLKGSSFPFKDL
jgi:hypothetical protein